MPSPALLFYPELIRGNIAEAIRIAGSPERLRPHAKTHKTREVGKLELDAGISKHKVATIAEAELLADAGAPDVLIAYPLVGPNTARLVQLMRKFPDTRFSSLIDDAQATAALGATLDAAGLRGDVLMDINCGQNRTGIAPDEAARELYRLAAGTPGLNVMGLHIYDGHQRAIDFAERDKAVRESLAPCLALRKELEEMGLPVRLMVCGGSPTFPVYAAMDFPGLELSPGTFALHDVGYGERFPDMAGFTPAAVVLTRVISKPTSDRLTLDLGTKAVASDPPAGQRCVVPEIPDATMVGQNEEHLIIQTPAAGRFHVGDALYAFPMHVCPTSALYRAALAVEGGRIVGEWPILARDRVLTV